MKFDLYKIFLFITCGLSLLMFSCEKEEEFLDRPVSSQFDQIFYATAGNVLYTYNTRSVRTPQSKINITGLDNGNILSLDFRPATGELYALSDLGKLYVLNTSTGVARALSSNAFTPVLNSANARINFDPTTDLIRLITDKGQNLRIDPTTGLAVKVEEQIVSKISGIAYTNNTAGATSTVMYALDATAGKLYKQKASSATALQEVGNLGVTFESASFDINPAGTQAVIVGKNGASNSTYEVDLNTGAATLTGKFYDIKATTIAIPTNRVAYGMSGTDFVIFNLTSDTHVSKAATGLQPNESILGMDIRPASGQLFAIGSSNRIYRVNMATAAFTQVATLNAALNGQSFGMDFNPSPDGVITLVSNTGQNLSITLAGAVTANPAVSGTRTLTGLAYSNNYADASTTTTYAISDNDSTLVSIVPSTGVPTRIGSLGVTITEVNGFDIVTLGTTNQAFGVFSVANKTNIYSINLSSGSATAIGSEITIPISAFALGLRL